MKRITTFLGFLIIMAFPILLVDCKKDDPAPLTEQQQAAKKLSGTWGSAEVLSSPVSGADGTLENLTLTFEVTGNFQPEGFTSTGTPEIFQTDATSMWSWESTSSTTRILLSNVTPVQEFIIEELTEATLTISFVFDGPVGGRTTGIGEYHVKLTRL